ncbi:hypothetical protein D3C87_1676660 [compost metagenome]
MGKQLKKAAQIDRVLRQPAAAIGPQDDVEGVIRLKPVPVDEQPIGFREKRAVQHRGAGNHAGRDEAQARKRHAAAQIFGKNRKPFLHALVACQARAEEPEPLRRAVEIGQQVHADFVIEQGFDAVPAHGRAARNQELAS